MGQPNFDQLQFRVGDDNGSESAHGWLGTLGQDLSMGPSQTITDGDQFFLRFTVINDGAKVGDFTPTIEVSYNGGTYADLAATGAIKYATNATYLTDGDDTTDRLGDGGSSGTFDTTNAGVIEGAATGASNSYAINGYIEVLVVCEFDQSQAVANGDYYDVRVKGANSWTDIPRFTIANLPVAVVNQRSHRIRTDDTETLASTSGWAGIAGADASLPRGKAFRIRFELDETGGVAVNQAYELRYQKNGAGGYTAVTGVPYESAASYPVIWGVISDQYAHGDAITSAQVSQSAKTFTNGHGVEDTTGDVESNSVSLNNQATELEYTIRIPHIYDGPTYNAVSDYFDFRLYTAAGVALDNYIDTPRVTVTNQSGHIGGCPAETQGKWGPWVDGNGNLYYVTEATEVDNEAIMMKSTDDGVTWASVDDASRPGLTDLESADAVQVAADDAIYMAWDEGGAVNFCVFYTSDDATYPDSWGDAGNSSAPETVVSSKTENDQGCALVYRSDGTFVCFYRSGTTSEVIKYKIRSSGGVWGSENDLDTTNTNQIGVHAIKGSDSDWIHIFYTTEETVPNYIRHRSMNPSTDALTASEIVYNDAYDGGSGWQWGMTAPIAWDNGTNDYVGIVCYDDSDNYPYFVKITDDGSPGSAVQIDNVTIMNDPTWMTSRSPVGRLFVDSNDDLYFMMADSSTQDLYIYTSTDDGATWSDQTTPEEVKDGMTIEMIIGNVLTLSGTETLCYIYADRYGGFTDWVFFDTYELTPPPVSLVIQESKSTTHSENIALTQHNVLVIGEANTSTHSDNLDLTQHNVLVIQESKSTTHSDNIASLPVNFVLTIQESKSTTHSENIALTQHNILVIDESKSTTHSDNLGLTQHNVLVIQESKSTTHSDNLDLITGNVDLIIQDSVSSTHSDNMDLIQHNILVIQDSNTSTHSDNLGLVQHNILVIQDSKSATQSDNLDFVQHNVLSIQDSTSATVSDSLDFIQHNVLVIQDSTSLTKSDNVVFYGAGASVWAALGIYLSKRKRARRR